MTKPAKIYPRIERMPLSKLKAANYNPRTITDESLGRLTRSLSELGTLQPITVNARTGNVVGGHQRLKSFAAMKQKEVDVWLVDLPAEKEKAANLALNNLAGQWDVERLRPLLAELEAADLLEVAGFDAAALEEYMAPAEVDNNVDADPQMDKAEELRAKWGVELGQVWQLGEHRIACGDSTSAEVVKRLLGDEKPHLMVTDPPYGVEYDASWRKEAMPETNPGKTGGMWGKVSNDHIADWTPAWELFPGDVAYVWHADRRAGEVQRSIETAGFVIRCQIVLAKQQFVIGRGDYHWQHEPCWYAVREGKVGHWSGDRSQTTLWQIDKPQKSETGHSTQKPIECMERPVRNNSKPGDLVYEPFSGSGTTIIACERTGRKCRAIELNPAYVAVAIQRWADATGKEPRKL